MAKERVVIPLALLPVGNYTDRIVLVAEPEHGDKPLMAGGGLRRGYINLTCGSCQHVLGGDLHQRSLRSARLMVFVCPRCGRANALDT